MKQIMAVIMALLVATVTTVSAARYDFNENEYEFPNGVKMLVPSGTQPTTPLPVGTVIHADRPPEQRVTLQNGVVTSLIQLTVDLGTWVVSGACTIQDTVYGGSPVQWPDPLSPDLTGQPFLYSYSAIGLRPDHMPGGALDSIDARPRSTYWFTATPPTRAYHFVTDPVYYLLVESYGSSPPDLSQAFGAIIAWKVSN